MLRQVVWGLAACVGACVVSIDRGLIRDDASIDGGSRDAGTEGATDSALDAPVSDAGPCSTANVVFCDDFETAPLGALWDDKVLRGTGDVRIESGTLGRLLRAGLEANVGTGEATLRKLGVISLTAPTTVTVDVSRDIGGGAFLAVELGDYHIRLWTDPLRLTTVNATTTNTISYSESSRPLAATGPTRLSLKITPPGSGAGTSLIELDVRGERGVSIPFDDVAASLMSTSKGDLRVGALMTYSSSATSEVFSFEDVVVTSP